jgi:hypothetical protein
MQREHVTVEAVFITETAENMFTKLPVRPGNVPAPPSIEIRQSLACTTLRSMQ